MGDAHCITSVADRCAQRLPASFQTLTDKPSNPQANGGGMLLLGVCKSVILESGSERTRERLQDSKTMHTIAWWFGLTSDVWAMLVQDLVSLIGFLLAH